MNKIDQVGDFLLRITSDVKLSASHISICTALCSAWIENGLKNPFRISRKKVMTAAKIKSTSTYHRILKDLTVFDYLNYTPSFHPVNGSKVFILDIGSKGEEKGPSSHRFNV